MPLSDSDLTEIEQVLTAGDPSVPVFAELRKRFPALSWTQCDASDVTEAPFRSYSAFDLHLLDTADHCAHITLDPATATGVILARRS
ncbi:hypothetical protein ABLE93_24355 [Xanthobacter sp. KR7-65]|uniref:hypothetical protein n=1 Tax=Xanthobacter sp. KR7-65 TaxID=3156612 RepID=UPI0032B416D9